MRRESGRVLEQVGEPAFAQRRSVCELFERPFPGRVLPDGADGLLNAGVDRGLRCVVVFCATQEDEQDAQDEGFQLNGAEPVGRLFVEVEKLLEEIAKGTIRRKETAADAGETAAE
jgi:hypothetical protein